MAPTFIRVKRKLDEIQEVDTKIVLNCKKQKINEKDVYSQFSFLGTVEEKQDHIPEYLIQKISKKQAEDIVQSKNKETSLALKERVSQNLEKSKEKRFKVVNFLRSSENSEDVAKTEQIILDVEKDEISDKLDNETACITDEGSSESYVYDIYMAQDQSNILQADLIDLNDLSILDYNDYLYSCPRLTNQIDDDEEHDDYDEDSNDENNWRNDYPDEDEFSDVSIDERAMRRAMLNFDGENELSTTDEDYYDGEYDESKENDFAYSIDTEENEKFNGDYDFAGTSYTKYRKRIMKDLECDSESSTDSE